MKKFTLVAIAKDEGKYIAEWIAFHLSIGVSRISVYVNDSADKTAEIVGKLSHEFSVVLVDWPSARHRSPQRAAYNDAVRRFSDTEWMGFWDVDEFIVPFGYTDLPSFLAAIPPAATAVGINTRIFGSSGVTDPSYDSVLHTFRRCSHANFRMNRHIKTIVRPGAVQEAHIHHVDMKYGESVNSAFEPLVLPEVGRTADPVHAGIQINHYQGKTLEEFSARRDKGNANYNPRHSQHFNRPFTEHGFRGIDRNEIEDTALDPFMSSFDKWSCRIRDFLTSSQTVVDQNA